MKTKELKSHSEKIYQGAMTDLFAVIKEVNEQIDRCVKKPKEQPAPKVR